MRPHTTMPSPPPDNNAPATLLFLRLHFAFATLHFSNNHDCNSPTAYHSVYLRRPVPQPLARRLFGAGALPDATYRAACTHRPGQLKHFPPHRRLLFQVVPAMPRLELLGDPLPPALYSGELCRCVGVRVQVIECCRHLLVGGCLTPPVPPHTSAAHRGPRMQLLDCWC